jgi:hypothetical protein
VAQPQHTPVVPLEAGAGPANPPCPACGEPLFGLIGAKPGLAGPVSACESCGLGVLGDHGDTGEALRALDGLTRGGEVAIANRKGFAAWLGGAGWSGLQPGAQYLYTTEAVRRLVANRDQVVTGARWAPGAGVALMWQTVLNSITFGRNVALAALGGRAQAVAAGRPWQRRLDALISVIAAIPALAIALPIELLGAIVFRRGGALKLRLELL